MKFFKHLSFLLVVSVFFTDCSKNSGAGTPTMSYTVSGLTDVTVRQYADTTFIVPIAVGFTSGSQEQVTITVDNVPAGLTATPTTMSGTPSFIASISFTGKIVTAGTYQVSIYSKSTNTDKKTFKFNIIVSPGSAFAYSFSGLSNIALTQYVDTTIALPLNVAYVSGVNERVTIKADGLPAGVTATPDTAGGIPPFAATFNLHVTGSLAPGSHPFTFHTLSASSGSQAITNNIVVSASSNCAPEIRGSYTTNTTCTSWTGAGTGAGTSSITGNAVINEDLISLPFITLTADLNCSAGTLTTQPKINSSFNVPAGSGTFTYNTVVVHYTLTGDINSDCTTTFTR